MWGVGIPGLEGELLEYGGLEISIGVGVQGLEGELREKARESERDILGLWGGILVCCRGGSHRYGLRRVG